MKGGTSEKIPISKFCLDSLNSGRVQNRGADQGADADDAKEYTSSGPPVLPPATNFSRTWLRYCRASRGRRETREIITIITMLRLIRLFCFENHILTKITFVKNKPKSPTKMAGIGERCARLRHSLRSLSLAMSTKSVLCRATTSASFVPAGLISVWNGGKRGGREGGREALMPRMGGPACLPRCPSAVSSKWQKTV